MWASQNCVSFRISARAESLMGAPVNEPLTTSWATGWSTMNLNGYVTVTLDPLAVPAAPMEMLIGTMLTVTASLFCRPPILRYDRTIASAAPGAGFGRMATRAPSRAALVSTCEVK